MSTTRGAGNNGPVSTAMVSSFLTALVCRVNGSGHGCIGGPDQAIAYIQRIIDLTGGFGAFLLTAHD
jgi:hypothetical protein